VQEQFDRRFVGPVQVVEQHHQRLPCAETPQSSRMALRQDAPVLLGRELLGSGRSYPHPAYLGDEPGDLGSVAAKRLAKRRWRAPRGASVRAARPNGENGVVAAS
jgi:hypothetical protein